MTNAIPAIQVKKLSDEGYNNTGGEGGYVGESSQGSESEFPPSETERLRDGIKAALSCLAPYKTHWPHVSFCSLGRLRESIVTSSRI